MTFIQMPKLVYVGDPLIMDMNQNNFGKVVNLQIDYSEQWYLSGYDLKVRIFC